MLLNLPGLVFAPVRFVKLDFCLVGRGDIERAGSRVLRNDRKAFILTEAFYTGKNFLSSANCPFRNNRKEYSCYDSDNCD